MSTPREEALEIAISAIEVRLRSERDELEQSKHGKRVIIQVIKLSNQLRRKLGADDMEERA